MIRLKVFISSVQRPRNPLVVQGLTWLELMDDRGSGIKRMRAAMAERNLDPPEFDLEFDAMTLSLVPAEPDAAAGAGQATPEATPEVAVVAALDGEMTRQALQTAMGLKDGEYFRKAYLLPALEADLIEMTIPDKPRSPKQKYRRTAKGEVVREELEGMET